MRKTFFIFLSIFLFLPFFSLALEIPMGVSPKEIVVEKFVSFDEPLNVDYLPDGTPGYLAILRGDGVMKNGDHTSIPLSGIRYTIHFWNVGEAGGKSGFWLWKKNYDDATLTVNYEVVGAGNKWIKTEKGLMGKDSFTMEVPNKYPEFNPVVYNLTFSGGPNGEFNEKKPYKNMKGNPLWGSVNNGETLGLNFPPNIEIGDNPFRVDILPFGVLNLDKNIFGDWPVVKEDCIDSHASFGSFSGTVEVKKIDKGEWVFAKYDMVLCAGDIIKTGEESRAHVLWPYKDYFLDAETSLLIKKMPKPTDRTAVEIMSGKIKANFQKALEGKDIYTEEGYPNYVMGIKGTTIEAEVSGRETTLRTIEGEVVMSPKSDLTKKIIVKAGEEFRFDVSGVVSSSTFDSVLANATYLEEKAQWIKQGEEARAKLDAESQMTASMPVEKFSFGTKVIGALFAVLLFFSVGLFLKNKKR